jgi:hypothetical protein
MPVYDLLVVALLIPPVLIEGQSNNTTYEKEHEVVCTCRLEAAHHEDSSLWRNMKTYKYLSSVQRREYQKEKEAWQVMGSGHCQCHSEVRIASSTRIP